MTTSISSDYSSSYAARLAQQFKKIDSNSDGTVDRSEFVAGRPSDLDADRAGTLFDTLDSQKTGSLDQSSFISAFAQMGNQTRSALLQTQSVDYGSGDTKQDSSDRLSELDTDGDGKVSRDEFIAGRPQDVSEDQSGALYDSIAGDTTDGLTTDQLAQGMRPAGGPPPRPEESQSSDSSDSQSDPGALLDELLSALQNAAQSSGATGTQPDASDLFSKLDTDGDGTVSRDEFVAGRPQDVSEDQSSAFYDTIAGDNGESLTQDQFVSGFNAAAPGSTTSTADASSTVDPSKLVDELIRAIRTYQTANYQNSATMASSNLANTLSA